METIKADLASLKAHRVPEWYEDAKFGIFIHWGLFSVPGFAPSHGSIGEVFANHYDIAVAATPYTEWYANAIKVPESESARHHAQVYGGAPYEDFRAPFLEGLQQWEPRAWARLFKEAGAKYVVLVTKHHDGYSLWPTGVAHPGKDGWHTQRDIVGELGEAVRAEGLRYGLYYSGGIDWSFNATPLRTLGDFVGSVPGGKYPAYAVAQVKELVERYRPEVLWNDISWPTPMATLTRVFAHYYNSVPEGVVNDRWMPATWKSRLMRFKAVRRRFDAKVKAHMAKAPPGKGLIPAEPPHYDFRTPEYMSFPDIQARKWEATRGMSHSFGFNRQDRDEDYLSVEEIVRGFVDAVSKNGNLLLNIGPRGEDARIPEEQVRRLRGLGAWLALNGEAIYGTRPWTRAEGTTRDGMAVRFTRKGETVYAITMGTPRGAEIAIRDFTASEGAKVALPGHGDLRWRNDGGDLTIELPQGLDASPALCFSVSSVPA
jgi:alpha-L-fucosidase